MKSNAENRIKGIETHSIDYIPPDERYGKPFNQFTLWYGLQLSVIFVGTGCFAPMMGLNLAWSMVAIILGNMIGSAFMSFHSAQGPHLGIPQMIQSRAQFGIKGAVIPLVLAMVLYIGYYMTILGYASQALEPITFIPYNWGVILIALVSLVIGIYGYEIIHKTEVATCVIGTILFGVVTVAMLIYLPLPSGQLGLGHVNIGAFLFVLGVNVSQLTITAPYVADYSRYLPESVTVKSTFLNTWLGGVVGCCWMGFIGAYLYITIPEAMDTNATMGIANTWAMIVPSALIAAILMLLASLGACTVNLYGAFMSTVTTFSPFTKMRGSKKSKVIIMTAVMIFGILMVLFGTDNLIAMWGNFLAIILYFIIPWTAINLTDYYFVRKGNYSLKDIFDINGIYGSVNKKTLVVYFLTILFEIPFMSTTLFTGPIANMIGGADIAWLVATAFAAILYYVLNRDIAKTTSRKDGGMHVEFTEKEREELEKLYNKE